MSKFDYDLFVIGAGSGGVRASRIAANHGAKVAIAEAWRVGGTCVLRGCVPKKLLVYGAHVAHDIEDARGYGWTIEGRHDWPKLIEAKDVELTRLNKAYLKLLSDAGVTLIESRARVTGPNEVEVNGKKITARVILVATGGWPVLPPIPGKEFLLTSNEALDLKQRPECIAVMGGGYIAVEFAGIFNAFGSKVIQLYRGEQILRGFDREVRDFLADELRKKGVDLRLRNDLVRIDKLGERLKLTLLDGSTLEADAVLAATGRAPTTHDLGLKEIGVALSDKNGAVIVDEWSRTSVPSIYAVGDVTDRINLTPVAIAEGHAFADTVFGSKPRAMNHADVPSAVFSQPPVSVVGLNEETARAKGHLVDVYRANFKPMKHTLSGSGERSLMKLVVDRATDRVLGVHMVGMDAPEIIQGLAVALKAGATKAVFDATIGIHPTAAEEFVTMRTKAAEPTAKAAE